MRLWRGVGLFFSTLVAWPLAAAPAEAVREAEVPKVSIEFTKVEVREAMRQLGEQTKIDFIVTPGVQGTLTAKFVNERLDRVLRVIGVALGCEVQLVEGVFVLRRPGETKAADTKVPGAATAAATPAAGAGALLPGTTPTTPLPDAGPTAPAAPLVGAAGETPPVAAAPGKPTGTKRETIPLKYRSAEELARMLGAGYVDFQGRVHQPGEVPIMAPGAGTVTTTDPYRNLPPGARVSRNGTIMLPNGTTILPSGVIIAPNGTVYSPQQRPQAITVPYGTTPQSLQNQWSPYLPQNNRYGTINGTTIGTNQAGTVIGPTTVRIGPATVMLPGVQIGNGGTQQIPVTGYQVPQVYYGTTPPNVTYGKKPGNWTYGLPPDWHFVPPTG